MQIIERLGWMLFHSGWQILLIACSYGIMLSVFRFRWTSARYAIGCLALVLMAVAPVVTFLRLSPYSGGSETSSVLADAFPQPVPERKAFNGGGEPADRASGDLQPGESVVADEPGAGLVPQNTNAGPAWIRSIRSAFPCAVAFWLMGVLVFSFRLVLERLMTQRGNGSQGTCDANNARRCFLTFIRDPSAIQPFWIAPKRKRPFFAELCVLCPFALKKSLDGTDLTPNE